MAPAQSTFAAVLAHGYSTEALPVLPDGTMKRVSGAASMASRTSRDEFWYPSEALTIRMPASAAWSKALAMSAVDPSPL